MLHIDPQCFDVDSSSEEYADASQEITALSIDRGQEGPSIRIEALGKRRFSVVRLGPREAWIELSGASLDVNRPFDLWIDADGRTLGPIRATPSHLPSMVRERPWLALRLAANREMTIQIAALLVRLASAGMARIGEEAVEERETIDSPDRIATIITALLRGARPAMLLDQGTPRPCWGKPAGAGQIAWGIDGAPASLGPTVVELQGYASVYRLFFEEARPVEEHFVTGQPTRIERVRRRRLRRAAPTSAFEVMFTTPLFLDYPARRRVLDLSPEGLSFSAIEADALFPGLTIDPFLITRTDEPPIRFRAQVRSVRERPDGTKVVGVSLQPVLADDGMSWVRFASKQLGPATEVGGSWDGEEWDVFERSGYFGLSGKTPAEFEQLRSALARTSTRLSNAPQLSCQSVWRSQRGVEATVWTLRAYQNTWLGHQLAKLPSKERPAQILREMYLHIWETAAASNARWLLCYQEAHIKWVQNVHLDFARPHEASGRAAVLPFRLTETDTAEAPGPGPTVTATDATIGIAAPLECTALWEHIARTRPRPYSEALDFVSERAELRGLTAAWRAAGLERSRSVYVARVDGRPIAAAVVETAEEGTNLFRLLDGVRLFELTPGGSRCFAALLDSARTHYRDRGKPSFVYYMEDEDPGLMEAARLRDLGEGYIWILSGDLLPEFLEHTCHYTWARDGGLRKGRAN